MIRDAILKDVPELVALGQRFLAESSYAGVLRENPEQMADTAQRLIEQEDGAVLVAEDWRGRIAGTIGLFRFAHHFSGSVTVGEVFFFVEPESRGLIGVRLLKAAQQWAQASGAQSFQVVAPEGATRVEALYRALQFQPLERAFYVSL